MINFINPKYVIGLVVVLFLVTAGVRIKNLWIAEERLKNLEVENVQRQKAKQAEEAFDHCAAARGLSHCVPDNTWRKD